MKKLYRRSISGLMALLICFTTILGGGITAFAASSSGEVAKSYSIGFPRSGDANLDYSGTWGHDELHYMNGWTSGEATWMTTLHTIGSFDGPACYCIEPGVPRLLEKTYTRYGEDYWKNYPSDYNSTIDADTIKTLLGRIMQYGYQGDLSLDWRSQNEADADKMAHMMATQVLVWETVVGERDANFNHVDPGSADAVKSMYRTSHPLYSRFSAYYDSIEANVQSHTVIPSFMSKTPNKAQTVELKWDGNQYTAKVLAGAVIGLFRTDDGEFTKETALMTATSKEDGSFSFEGIPYGTWYIREIEQPAGFVLDDTVYPVSIGKDAQVVEIKIVNKYIRGNIHLTKVDAEYPDNKLTGATFEVYKDSNGSGKLDDGDELLGTLTEKEIGSYEMKDLFYGRYFVKETKAPEGFVLDTGVYEVMIDTDGKTCEVENKAGVGFINEAMRGNLKIVKTSSDGKIKGFAFRITGANGYDIILETNDKGEIVIEGIRIGDYTVSEVSNSASAMYVLPADKKATVKTGSTTIVEMHNVLRDTPKTGDATNLPLLYALAGLSAVGIAVTAFVGFKKKKKEGND